MDLDELERIIPPDRLPEVREMIRYGERKKLAAAAWAVELKAGATWRALFPRNLASGATCDPDRPYALAPRGACSAEDDGLTLFSGMQVLRFATHPADARAGWSIVGGSLKLNVDAISAFQDEMRFDAFHWALSRVTLPWTGFTILEQVRLSGTAVLRAPEPRPMVHGFWIEVYDPRLRCGYPTSLAAFEKQYGCEDLTGHRFTSANFWRHGIYR